MRSKSYSNSQKLYPFQFVADQWMIRIKGKRIRIQITCKMLQIVHHNFTLMVYGSMHSVHETTNYLTNFNFITTWQLQHTTKTSWGKRAVELQSQWQTKGTSLEHIEHRKNLWYFSGKKSPTIPTTNQDPKPTTPHQQHKRKRRDLCELQ